MERKRPESVNALAFDPTGQYLVGATSVGRLHLWEFLGGMSDSDEVQPPTRRCSIRAHSCSIYALELQPTGAAGRLMLLTGADEEICGWWWDDVLAASDGGAMPTPVLRLENTRVALRRGALGQLSETSALAVDAVAGRLYSAAGDGNAYVWDLGTQKCVATYEGVGEPLHCLTLCQRRQQLITGGEDGKVRLWDVRAAQCTQVLRPDAPPLATAATPVGGDGGGANGNGSAASWGGGWCGCVATDAAETWLVAGWGEGFLCSIDLNTHAAVACLPTAAAPLAACFAPASDFHVISVGAEPGLYHWHLTGELETRATCSSPSALGLAISKASSGAEQLIAVGGSAGTVDVFTDTSHKAFTMRLPA